jgi:hypothetical protein
MKYLIGNQCINGDHIIMAKFYPADPKIVADQDECHISLTSTEPGTNYDGDPVGGSITIVVILTGTEARRFWGAYISDAYTVVNP